VYMRDQNNTKVIFQCPKTGMLFYFKCFGQNTVSIFRGEDGDVLLQNVGTDLRNYTAPKQYQHHTHHHENLKSHTPLIYINHVNNYKHGNDM
jgi:hypothetical protein